MNYLNIYNNLITSRLTFQTERSELRKKKAAYFESHHIVPKCLNGTDVADNLILLTAREHFIAHWLLWKGYADEPKLALAFNMMLTSNKYQSDSRKNIQSSRVYETLRIETASYMSEFMKEYRKNNTHPSTRLKGENHWNYGRKHSDEHRKNISEMHSGENHWTYGKPRPQETRDKISKANKGRKLSEEARPKVLEGLKKAKEARKNNDHTYWRMNHVAVDIWKIADLIYDEWVVKKPGSRKLGRIIDRLSNEHNIETPSRNETMLRYFREHGNPADNEDWCKKYKS